ncbi:acetylornithine deacetylase [Bermanella sp. WJH001]|uniref:acetylornithine deacetylase n=1 Tax=Bermanella sp. WJH001 TaxID=3048005 RepID=UPI0024BEBAD0|nr:acetylornithine deacetylase [Bermanella sp. WJH001]MDJ1538650.1 acetylornithine deacetylase [Bermanella sp. WJH001]
MKHLPNIKQQLSTLLSLPSISSALPDYDMSNKGVIDQIASWCETLGFKVDIQCIDKARGKFNLLATLGSGPGGLILSGHTDTVPCNIEKWQSDPFKLTDKDNRFYGLGSCDMKGFFALALAAIEKVDARQLKAPIFILATADEETSMSGARALATLGLPKARAAIIGEPTSLKPINMHKGILMEGIKITGQAGHSSDPELGNNAMDAMHTVISELKDFRQQLKQEFKHTAFSVPSPTLNLGCIHGGDNPNRICGQCELHFDLRMIPGMNTEQLRQRIQDRLDRVAKQTQTDIEFYRLFDGVDAFASGENSELVALAEKLSGHGAEAVAFATEAPFLAAANIDTVVMGAGSIDQAHQPDEYMAHDQIEPMVKYIGQFIKHYCL